MTDDARGTTMRDTAPVVARESILRLIVEEVPVPLIPAALTVGELRRELLRFADDTPLMVCLGSMPQAGWTGQVSRVRTWVEFSGADGTPSRKYPELLVLPVSDFELPDHVEERR